MAILAPLTGLLSLAKALGWFAQASWDEGGAKVNKAYSQLKQITGKRYPEIEKQLQTVHKAWRTFQHALPWDKQRTAQEYYNQVRKAAGMIESEAKKFQEMQKIAYQEAQRRKIIFASLASIAVVSGIIIAVAKRKK